MNKLLIIASFSLLAVWGCSKGSSFVPGPEDKPVQKIELKITGQTRIINITKADDVLVALDQGTQLGVYSASVNDGETVVTAAEANKLYSVTNNLGTVTSAQPILLTVGDSYNIYSYAPRKASPVIDGSTIKVTFDHADDVLFSPMINLPVVAQGGTAYIIYRHQMSQVKFNIAVDPEHIDYAFLNSIVDQATLEVTGFYKNCVMDLSTGNITNDAATDPSVKITAQNQRTCFIPNPGNDMTLPVKIELNGKTYKTTITREFLRGYSYSYYLLISDLAEVMVTATVTEWQSGTGTGEVE